MHIVGIGSLGRYIFHVRGKRAGNFDEGDKRRRIAQFIMTRLQLPRRVSWMVSSSFKSFRFVFHAIIASAIFTRYACKSCFPKHLRNRCGSYVQTIPLIKMLIESHYCPRYCSDVRKKYQQWSADHYVKETRDDVN
jgi:hypothetical protein